MHKTLHKELTKKAYKTHASLNGANDGDALYINLLREMAPYLQEAANDLLQPRPEAVAAILRKAKMN